LGELLEMLLERLKNQSCTCHNYTRCIGGKKFSYRLTKTVSLSELLTTFLAFSAYKTTDPPPSLKSNSLPTPSNEQIEELNFHRVWPPTTWAQSCPSPPSPHHPLHCRDVEGCGRMPPLKPLVKATTLPKLK
jgi:hypothetical protein